MWPIKEKQCNLSGLPCEENELGNMLCPPGRKDRTEQCGHKWGKPYNQFPDSMYWLVQECQRCGLVRSVDGQ